MPDDNGKTTFEEAKECPKCHRPGKEDGVRAGRRRGVLVHTIRCMTQLCPWYNTTWLVQVNEDGSIPEAYSQLGAKQFPKVSQQTETRINEALQRQLEAEVRGDGEVRNPHGG
jgi:hypothetical protein